MAIPRIFISSTFRDLKDVREEIREFVQDHGFNSVLFEDEDVVFEPNLLIEDSCYEEVKSCSMLILIIRSNYGTRSSRSSDRANACSITQLEYCSARDTGIPIYVFIDQRSYDEYNSYVIQGRPDNFKFSYLENSDLAHFIDIIYNDKAFMYLHTYNKISDIKYTLKKQWAGLLNNYLNNSRKATNRKKELIYINCFKLFYFRRNRGLTQEQLAKKANIAVSKIKQLEDAGAKRGYVKVEDFELSTLDEAQRIANALQCYVGNIKADLPDDYLAQYLSYYFSTKGTRQRRKTDEDILSLSKIVLFDFDGTLTKSDDNLTTWERIWLFLGYDINECAELHRKFNNSEISHKEWCRITEEKFKLKNLNIKDLDKIADDIHLIDGTREVIETLVSNDIKLYIVSGSIKYIIRKVLGDLIIHFETIKANDISFDSKGQIKAIIGTRYDFEGKSNFISQVVNELQIHSFEAFFVGNSLNDEWAHQSGAQTLCVNPSMTNPDHRFKWNYSIRTMTSLKEIFKYLKF